MLTSTTTRGFARAGRPDRCCRRAIAQGGSSTSAWSTESSSVKVASWRLPVRACIPRAGSPQSREWPAARRRGRITRDNVLWSCRDERQGRSESFGKGSRCPFRDCRRAGRRVIPRPTPWGTSVAPSRNAGRSLRSRPSGGRSRGRGLCVVPKIAGVAHLQAVRALEPAGSGWSAKANTSSCRMVGASSRFAVTTCQRLHDGSARDAGLTIEQFRELLRG
jgi:hypothetical protein